MDLIFAYNCSLESFSFKPFIGVRGAKIHESVNATVVTDISLIVPVAAATQTKIFDDRQNYHGIGPIVGLEGEWDVGCGFGIYGTAAAGLMYGKYKVHMDDVNLLSDLLIAKFFHLIEDL